MKLTPDELTVQQQGNWIKEMTQTNGWKMIMLPLLVDKISHTWTDPRKAKTDDDLLFEYKLAWAYATAAQEIIELVQKMIEESEALTNKEQGKGELDKLRESLS